MIFPASNPTSLAILAVAVINELTFKTSTAPARAKIHKSPIRRPLPSEEKTFVVCVVSRVASIRVEVVVGGESTGVLLAVRVVGDMMWCDVMCAVGRLAVDRLYSLLATCYLYVRSSQGRGRTSDESECTASTALCSSTLCPSFHTFSITSHNNNMNILWFLSSPSPSFITHHCLTLSRPIVPSQHEFLPLLALGFVMEPT
jgi:hypothetical protein